MTFEWDENKNRQNIRKHGIDFADVVSLFEHPMVVGLDERVNYGEERWVGLGMLGMVLAVVVFVENIK